MASSDERRYQVFISSTFRDLEQERQKALQAVLELKAFPSGMELFPSANDEQWEFIKREIDSSDYYVLILAGKYGSVARDGVSFTEKEYDYAIQTGKPTLSFLHSDLNELKGSQLESSDERRAQLQRFHDKVKRGKLVRGFKNSDELKSVILHALIHAFQFQPGEGWVKARHSRRLEDLEEITILQKRVMILDEENRQLKQRNVDSRDDLAQGDDIFEWSFQLSASEVRSPPRGEMGMTIVESKLPPPQAEWIIRVTWNHLLVWLFGDTSPARKASEIHRRLVLLIHEELAKSELGETEWFYHLQKAQNVPVNDTQPAITDITRQFLGLGYIDITSRSWADTGYAYMEEAWVLTERGKLQCALLAGHRRVRGDGDSRGGN